ncbi:microtubule-associated Nat9 isoform X2 [Lycorma delicatula]|uniref:microtubule-associated Nat9 isoform X2 n=1 Tax=Lycorma delicatula TaxID=130591 RepID=UPI003F513C04
MRKNSKTKIVGCKVVLVPYRESHVKRYNQWMQSKELQELTASDPLTEEEEYQMQKSWLYDENKCTFIVLDKELLEKTSCEVRSMIGDTNLYLTESDEGTEAETGIMIAESFARRKRMGWEAMLINIRYGIEELKINKFIAKISKTNKRSIIMFKKMGFEKESESEIFQEITLIKNVSDDWIKWLKSELKNYEVVETEENK